MSLQGLLKTSLKLSDQELREWPTNLEKMDPERQQWLQDAMSNVLKNQDIHQLKRHLNILAQGKAEELDENSLEEKSKALEEIQFLLDSDHNATDLHLIGGLTLITEYLSSPYSSLRWRAAEIVAEATQNKPVCQLAFTDSGGIAKLVKILNSDDIDIVKVKSMYALSCVIRNCGDALKSFLSLDGGLNALLASISSDFEKLKSKASFMITNLIAASDESIVLNLVSLNIVKITIAQLRSKHNSSHEHLINLLLQVIIRSKQALLQCQLNENALKKLLLDKRGKLFADDPEMYQEEISHCDKILEQCFPASSVQ